MRSNITLIANNHSTNRSNKSSKSNKMNNNKAMSK